MNLFTRGVRNAFRNSIRSFSIIIILAISIALALVMLLSLRAVQSRITSVTQSIGNTITVRPAGANGFEGGGNPLTTDQVDKIKQTPHVVSTVAILQDRLSNSSSGGNFGGGSGGTTNLVSPISPGQLGARRFGGGRQLPANFSLPIQVTGSTDPLSTQAAQANQLTITSGQNIDGSSTQNVALVGKDLASKNGLGVGSTFTAYGTTIKVSGIYDAGNTFANAGIIMPLGTVQNLSGQPGDVDNVIVTVDSITSEQATVSALQSELGSAADVISAQDRSQNALAPLENIKSISLYSLIGALIAGSVIIFLTMLMIVRERRREIGVLKAIGATNLNITTQFVTEALTLTLAGAVVGIAAGAALSNPILKVLAAGNSTTGGGGFGPGGGGRGFGRAFGGIQNTVASLHAAVSYDILLYGLAAAVVIAVLGSAVPSWFIAKIRPAEVMRAE